MIRTIPYRLLLFLILFLAGCGGEISQEPPAVAATDPGQDARDISTQAKISALFSSEIDRVTVTPQTFFIMEAQTSQIYQGEVTYENRTATFIPAVPFENGKQYTAILTTGIKDLDGVPLPSNYTWTFSTETGDITPPSITSKNPASNMSDVPVTADITIVFNEEIQEATLRSVVALNGPAGPVPFEFLYDPAHFMAILDPGTDLEFKKTYEVVLGKGIKDLKGNETSSEIRWSFTTASIPDRSRPTIVDHQPQGDAASVFGQNGTIKIKFSEPMDARSVVAEGRLVLRQGSERVEGSVQYHASSQTAVFIPKTPLKYATTYSVAVTGQMTDLGGNPLDITPSPFTWSFKTIHPPLVTANSPQGGSVSVNTAIVATFSRAMKSQSIHENSFTLQIPGAAGKVAAAVAYNPSTLTATLSPTGPLLHNTTYSVILTEDIQDEAGNPLEWFSWSFKTVVETFPPPAVVETRPLHRSVDVGVDLAQVSARFDQAIKKESLEGRMTVRNERQNSAAHSGGVDRGGSPEEAIFAFTARLLYDTWYLVTLEAGIESASHSGSTGGPYTWCFKTVADPNLVPPAPRDPPAGCPP